jgi:hypothetical protein
MRFVPGNSRTSSQVVLSLERALFGDSKELHSGIPASFQRAVSDDPCEYLC